MCASTRAYASRRQAWPTKERVPTKTGRAIRVHIAVQTVRSNAFRFHPGEEEGVRYTKYDCKLISGCYVTAQDEWQGGSIRPQYWNVQMCAANVYCCRAKGEDSTDCCNNTAALSTTTSALGLPTEAVAAAKETVTLSAVVSSGSTGLPITSTVVATATAPHITCTFAAETESCPGTSKIIAVGAGVGVSLGVSLLASLVMLGILMRRQKDLRNELARAHESAAREPERSMQPPYQGSLPARSISELDAKNGRVVEVEATNGGDISSEFDLRRQNDM